METLYLSVCTGTHNECVNGEYLLDLQGNLSIVLVQHGHFLSHGEHVGILAASLHIGITRDVLIACHHVC